MRRFLRNHSMMAYSLAFAVWIFVVWRLAGMPSPGFLGRLLPAAWLLAALLSGRCRVPGWIPMTAGFFTVTAWIWMIFEPGWIIAAASAASGLVFWGIRISGRGRFGPAAAAVPLLLVAFFTADINSDEVRFAEISASVAGISSEAYGEQHLRTGDISMETGHHTPVFPALISPGLLLGDRGIRLIPVLIALAAILLLGKLAGPAPAAVSALLYPGFAILGLAMTGWLAAGLFALWLLLGRSRKYGLIRMVLPVLLVAVKMRYAGLAAGMFLADYACSGFSKGKWTIPLTLAAGTVLFLAVDRYLLGGELFWIRYGNLGMLKIFWVNVFHKPAQTLASAGWSMVDPEAGLLFRAPWILASIYGLGGLAARSADLFRKAFIPSLFYWMVLILWSGSSWHGLPAPAGRVFVPMIPLFALGLAEVWKRKETRLLILISAAVTGLVSVYPHARGNFADGTDTLLALAGTVSGFSMVRSSGMYLILALLPPAAVLMLMTRNRWSRGFTVLVLFSAALAAGLKGPVPEAEDLPPGNLQGALLYPRDPDPVARYFWFGSRERMLELSEEGHGVIFPAAAEGDTMFIEASSSGGFLTVQGDTLEVRTILMDLPEEYRTFGRRQEDLPDLPQNRRMEIYRIQLREGVAGVFFAGGEPVYLDRIGIL